MEKTEIRYSSHRGNCSDDYQTLDVVQELGNNREFIKFSLMESRWRSVAEAADYLRWAASELEKLK